ncbi:MAG TPA: helix-turn-helix domain-containing protein, partial [Chitinophagaceae bacterium]|nr:helix-turn-helix domain-containing protein [Chitinophagaceae bacterium]
ALTNHELGKDIIDFTPEVENIFKNYVWHGNLRELKNVIKRATLLTDGDYVEAKTLPFEISNYAKLQFDASQESSAIQANTSVPVSMAMPETPRHVNSEITLKEASIDAEYEMILQALKKVNFNKSKAAKLLNIDRKTLYNKMKQYREFNNS